MKRFQKRMFRRLERELEKVRTWIDFLSGGFPCHEVGEVGDNTPLSEVVEAFQVEEEDEIRFELLSRWTARAESLERALARMHEGLYGICVECSRPILHERLEALPDATLCLKCQHDVEQPRIATGPEPSQRHGRTEVVAGKSG